MVYGGQISFCLYMVHELVHTSWTWAVVNFRLQPWHTDSPWRWNIFGLLAIAVLLSILLYHSVEEPARRWMRRMVDAPATPAGHNPDAPTVAEPEPDEPEPDEPEPDEPEAEPEQEALEAVSARVP
jgi:peptidoglycan/LPS O-acetylase OafA/YrhL